MIQTWTFRLALLAFLLPSALPAENPPAAAEAAEPVTEAAQSLEPAADLALPRYRLGVAWPELRARMNLTGRWDAELKGAFDSGAQVYSARLYFTPQRLLGPVGLELGAEAGWVRLAGLEGADGQGMVWQGIAAARWPFSRRFGLSLEFGPAWISLWDQGQSTQGMAWVYNSAVYFNLF